MKHKRFGLGLAAALLLGSSVSAMASEQTGVVTASALNVRGGASTKDSILAKLSRGTEVTVIDVREDGWYQIELEDIEADTYVKADYIRLTDESEESSEDEQSSSISSSWDGPVLTASAGVVYGPTGKETYYNLDMSGVIAIMRSMGNTDEYWIREDGVKMLGDYVMVAANLNTFPRGSLVECSLGTAIVCDTGGFAASNPTQLDIAVNW